MARLIELERQGQSVWDDDRRRGLMASGALARLVADGVCGVTSNPTRAFADAPASLLASITTKPEKGAPRSAGPRPVGARRGSWW
ncbi:MAG: hypothetical protein HY217_01165 [Candidatus Rokubacteria bacterium]|nr:hypothetical protein [Candidatus Rokubacteria bacterium]